MSNLKFDFGLYAETIERFADECKDLLDRASEVFGSENVPSFLVDDMTEYAKEFANECFDINNATNSFMQSYAMGTKQALQEIPLFNELNLEFDYYINGDDSHLYINNQDAWELEDIVKEALSEKVIEDIREHYPSLDDEELEDLKYDLKIEFDVNDFVEYEKTFFDSAIRDYALVTLYRKKIEKENNKGKDNIERE